MENKRINQIIKSKNNNIVWKKNKYSKKWFMVGYMRYIIIKKISNVNIKKWNKYHISKNLTGIK